MSAADWPSASPFGGRFDGGAIVEISAGGTLEGLDVRRLETEEKSTGKMVSGGGSGDGAR